MARKCATCKLESDFEQAFQSVKSDGRVRFYCLVCWEKRQQRTSLHAFVFAPGLAAIGIVSSFVPGVGNGFAWMIDIALVLGWYYVLVLPHELGHAVAGRLLGLRVFGICFGEGRRLAAFKAFGINFEVRQIPAGGATIFGHPDLQFLRCRQFLCTLAGPAVDASILAAAILLFPLDWLHLHEQLQQPFRFATTPWISNRAMFFGTFVAAYVLAILVNIFPHRTWLGSLRTENDGLQLLKIPFLTQDARKEMHAFYFAQEAIECVKDGRGEKAAEWCRRGLALYPENYSILNANALATYLAKDFVKSRFHWCRLLARPELDLNSRSLLFIEIALANVLIALSTEDGAESKPMEFPSRAELLQQADEMSREALATIPWDELCQGVRGCVLVEHGRIEEGLELLHDVFPRHEKKDRAYYACFIAHGEFLAGRPEKANYYLALARTIDPECVALEAVSHAMTGALAS